MKKILYGAGEVCEKVISFFGVTPIHYIVDRDPKKQGQKLRGIPIISIEEFKQIYQNFEVVYTTDYMASAERDLKSKGIDTSSFKPYFHYLIPHLNLYWFDFKIRFQYAVWNHYLKKVERKAAKWDLLDNQKDFESFQKQNETFERIQPKLETLNPNAQKTNLHYSFGDPKLRKKLRIPHQKIQMLRYQTGCWESLYFGHLEELYHYADVSMRKKLYLPHIEHGLTFSGERMPFVQHTNIIVSAPERRNFLHKFIPGRPIFCIGPYIHYARSIYNDEQICQWKQKHGKTLLLFPGHSLDLIKRVCDGSIYANKIIELYGDQYKTIMINVFYNDLKNTWCDALRQKGIWLVSAGFRFDPLFIQRLKTMILLADHISGDSVGTHIGYCVYLNKPYEYRVIMDIPCAVDLYQDNSHFRMEKDLVLRLFAPNGFQITPEQQDYVNKKWGLDQIKTPEEVREIVKICGKILHKCGGYSQHFQVAAQQVLENLAQKRNTKEGLQHKLLSEAMYDDIFE